MRPGRPTRRADRATQALVPPKPTRAAGRRATSRDAHDGPVNFAAQPPSSQPRSTKQAACLVVERHRLQRHRTSARSMRPCHRPSALAPEGDAAMRDRPIRQRHASESSTIADLNDACRSATAPARFFAPTTRAHGWNFASPSGVSRPRRRKARPMLDAAAPCRERKNRADEGRAGSVTATRASHRCSRRSRLKKDRQEACGRHAFAAASRQARGGVVARRRFPDETPTGERGEDELQSGTACAPARASIECRNSIAAHDGWRRAAEGRLASPRTTIASKTTRLSARAERCR